MDKLIRLLSEHKFKTHMLAFLLMVLPPVPLYVAAQNGAANWILALLGLVVAGNILALMVH